MIDKAWRRRMEVGILGVLAGLVLRVLYRTLRVRWTDRASVWGRRARGERFVFGRVAILFGDPIAADGNDEDVRPCVQGALEALHAEAERTLGVSP